LEKALNDWCVSKSHDVQVNSTVKKNLDMEIQFL